MATATKAASTVSLLLVVALSAPTLLGQTAIKLPKNKYTPQQDVELGREAAAGEAAGPGGAVTAGAAAAGAGVGEGNSGAFTVSKDCIDGSRGAGVGAASTPQCRLSQW